MIKHDAWRELLRKVRQALPPFRRLALAPVSSDDLERRYAAWRSVNGFGSRQAEALRELLDDRRWRLPLISVVMPVHNTQPAWLDRAIESVATQVYEHWELCIADDASTDPQTIDILRRWMRRDQRVKVEFRTENGGISRATNAAAARAAGEFIAFLDHDDELAPDALAEVALRCVDRDDVDLLYSDDDKIDGEGRRFDPQFKPDWSPILLLSYMYMSHLLVVRRELFDTLGGVRVGFEGSQDHDFALRAAERVRRVEHIPKVLYHWRAVAGSIALSSAAKPTSIDAGRRAVAEAFHRGGAEAAVAQPQWATVAGMSVFAPRFAHSGPGVAIIIPTRNSLDLLRPCLDSLARTQYSNFEVIIVDNESDEPETLRYLASSRYRVLRIGHPPSGKFNFAHLNNQAVRQLSDDVEYVLFLNNDTIARNTEWLSQMMGYARLPGVGAVGARLLFPDETIQHAGIVQGYYGGLAGPAFRNAPARARGYLAYLKVAREYSAVSAACLLTPRSLFLDLGGFDAERFAVAYNDVDYCHRLVDRGFRCVYCPSAELTHFEGKTRGHVDDPQELARFRQRYGRRGDRWYNPNLSLADEHFRIVPYHAPLRIRRPVRAVMISHNLNLEGAPKSQLELTLGLRKAGVLDPIVLSPEDGPLRAHYEEAGISVGIMGDKLSDLGPSAFEALGDLFRELGAEVIYANTLQTFWAIEAAERAGLPSLWNVRESEPCDTYFDYLEPGLRKLAYGCFAHPYRVVFVADATCRQWSRFETRFNFAVVRNGLDTQRLDHELGRFDRASERQHLGVGADEVMAVLVGTVCERKGQLDLVRALDRLPPAVVIRTRFFIIGDRPLAYSDELHRTLAALPVPLSARVAVIGETDRVPAYYKAADFALCTSRIESYPRVILEAMAAALPVVTTPVFGIREQVRDGVNGLFYEPGDIDALAVAIARLVEEPPLRQRLAANARSVLESLTSYDEALARYGDYFREARFSKDRPSTAALTQRGH